MEIYPWMDTHRTLELRTCMISNLLDNLTWGGWWGKMNGERTNEVFIIIVNLILTVQHVLSLVLYIHLVCSGYLLHACTRNACTKNRHTYQYIIKCLAYSVLQQSTVRVLSSRW